MRSYLLRGARFLWLLILICFSLAPWEVKHRLKINGSRHDLWHLTAFFLTVIIFSTLPECWFTSRPQSNRQAQNALRCLIAASVAVALELLEVTLFHNTFEWHDLTVDCSGIVLGFASLLSWQWSSSLERLYAT